MNDEEYSEGGSKIYRYEDKNPEFTHPESEDCSLEEITAHIEKYVGNPATVFHEIISDHVHVDVHVVEPTPERNYYTLVTSGMSDQPMNAPREEMAYAELMVCLPPDWKMKQEDFKDNDNYWIIYWLKMLARFPHLYETWLWDSHTMPNGDPVQPFASNTKMCCALLSLPMLFDAGFRTLQVRDDKTIHFLSLIPLYKEEMDYKLDKGIEKLYEKFDQYGVTELLDVSRRNTCQKRFGIF